MSRATLPLVVDLDGALISTDMLAETLFSALGRAPLQAAKIVARHWPHRHLLKSELADLAAFDPALLPYNPQVLALCEAARAEGRALVLASGSTQAVVDPIAAHLGIFDRVMASDAGVNLTGARKAAALVEAFGKGGFDYIGDSAKDIPVWAAARTALAVRPGQRLMARIAGAGITVQKIGQSWRWGALARAVRINQWIKNVLLFLPMIAAHRLDWASFAPVAVGALAFGCAASATYVINDLLDIEADRQHPRKRHRAFAAGHVPIAVGLVTTGVLGVLAFGLAALLGAAMVAVIAIYVALTLSYSFHLKRLRWVDVAVLAALYALRVVAGALAGGIAISGWLIGFMVPVFLTLGCVKRMTELARTTSEDALPGRSYSAQDARDLLNVAVMTAGSAVAVFGAYTFSAAAEVLYQRPVILYLSTVPVALWLARMVITGWRGTQNYDPIIFAMRDPWGLTCLAVTLAMLVSAAGLAV